MILASSLWTGCHSALRLRQTDRQLRDLTSALELMAGEIAFAATPFVPLCERAGAGRCQGVRQFFSALAREAARPEGPGEGRTRLALREAELLLPGPAAETLERLLDNFGAYDREGQLRQLSLATETLKRLSGELSEQMAGRCKTYRWLGLSAGAAVLILVI